MDLFLGNYILESLVHRLDEPGRNRHDIEMILIESEGLLLRGPAADHPLEIWDYPRKRWVAYRYAGPQPGGWGREISASAAEALKTANPDAEHYLYYDTPPWAQPISQDDLDAATEHLKKLIAERSAKGKKG